MGGGRYKPSFWEAVAVQILCFGFLIIVPIIWVVLIIGGLGYIVVKPSKAIESAQQLATMIGTVTAIPFVFTWEHCLLLCGKSNDDDDVCKPWHDSLEIRS